MTTKTIVTFDFAGRAQFTRGDKVAHDLLDNQFAFGDMLRVTDITMEPSSKRYIIQWLEGPFTNKLHSAWVYAHIFGKAPLVFDKCYIGGEPVLIFNTYELAVEHERECLAEMRKQGIIFS
jgi:hypothetical protein